MIVRQGEGSAPRQDALQLSHTYSKRASMPPFFLQHTTTGVWEKTYSVIRHDDAGGCLIDRDRAGGQNAARVGAERVREGILLDDTIAQKIDL